MPTKFPYLIKVTDLGPILTPYCWLEILTHKGIWRKQKFLFDTGADYTSLPKFMSQVVGFDLQKAKQEIMYTANNEPMITFLGQMTICLDKQPIIIPCVFTDRDDTPFLLGRAGLINKYNMLLSAQHKQLIFTIPKSLNREQRQLLQQLQKPYSV